MSLKLILAIKLLRMNHKENMENSVFVQIKMEHLTSDKKCLVESPAPLLFKILHCKNHFKKKILVQESV
jgi:hypothetical protein